MSREAVVDFLERVRGDAELRRRLEASPTLDAYVAEGARQGLLFDAAEARGVTQADRFYEQALTDPELTRRIEAVPNVTALVALARGAGCECDGDDLEAVVVGSARIGELSESDLDAVSGGGTSKSFPDVCKTPSPFGPIPIPYPSF